MPILDAAQPSTITENQAPDHPLPPATYEYLYKDVGTSHGRPFKILVASQERPAFGDMLGMIAVATKVAARFENAATTFYIPTDDPLLTELLALFPYRCQVIDAMTSRGKVCLEAMNPYACRLPIDRDGVMSPHWQDMVLAPTLLADAFFWGLGPEPLRVPEAMKPHMDQQLVALGLDPSSWFCCTHYREPTWERKRHPNIRDCDPAVYETLVDHVIGRQGGQIVRLGHPEMTPWQPRPGFLDLSRIPRSHLLQAYAASRARYCIGGPSGGMCLAQAFTIPTALTDVIDFWAGGHAGARVLTSTVVTPAGDRLRNQALFDSGLMNTKRLTQVMAADPRYRIVKNTAEELAQAADVLLESTSNCDAWRSTDAFAAEAPTNQVAWPPRCDYRHRFIEPG